LGVVPLLRDGKQRKETNKKMEGKSSSRGGGDSKAPFAYRPSQLTFDTGFESAENRGSTKKMFTDYDELNLITMKAHCEY